MGEYIVKRLGWSNHQILVASFTWSKECAGNRVGTGQLITSLSNDTENLF